jgi:lipid-binding SYLF domain-containing protein
MKLSFPVMIAACCVYAIALSCAGRGERPVSAPETDQLQQSIDVVKSMAAEADRSIPRDILKNARALAILPGMPKSAFGLGGRLCKGVMAVRKADSSWSYPAFIGAGCGGAGVRHGAELIDIVLIFRTSESVLRAASGQLTLGRGAGAAAAGPIGWLDSATTFAGAGAAILSYARVRGVLAGVSLDGVRLTIDSVANEAFYRSKSVKRIFRDQVPVVPVSAVRFVRTVTEASRPSPLANTDETLP